MNQKGQQQHGPKEGHQGLLEGGERAGDSDLTKNMLKEMEENSVQCRGMVEVSRVAFLGSRTASARPSLLMWIDPKEFYS